MLANPKQCAIVECATIQDEDMFMFRVKILLLIFFFAYGGVHSLHAKHEMPKVTVRPAGYHFSTSYIIHSLSHTEVPPLEVQLWMGRSSSVAFGPKPNHSGDVVAAPFRGELSCTIDGKEANIEFWQAKHNKLKIQKKHIDATSMWYAPLEAMVRSFWRYKGKAPSRSLFRIEPRPTCEMQATYSLDPTSSASSYPAIHVHITITSAHGKPTITATFYPHKNQSGSHPQSRLQYVATKHGIREVIRKHIDKRHQGWCGPVKRAAEKSLKQYFAFKKMIPCTPFPDGKHE